jgi:FtsH-binding integral membrane protein
MGGEMGMFTMVETATLLFVIAAAGGLVMAAIRLRGAPLPPAWLAMLHGFVAAAGLTLLVFAVLTDVVAATAKVALVCFLAAAVAGIAMYLGYRAKQKPLPTSLMFLHAGLAAAGVALMIASVV